MAFLVFWTQLQAQIPITWVKLRMTPCLTVSLLLIGGGVRDRRFANRREAMYEVIDRLMFCNHCRLHSTRNYMSPMQFEQRWLAEQRKKSA